MVLGKNGFFDHYRVKLVELRLAIFGKVFTGVVIRFGYVLFKKEIYEKVLVRHQMTRGVLAFVIKDCWAGTYIPHMNKLRLRI